MLLAAQFVPAGASALAIDSEPLELRSCLRHAGSYRVAMLAAGSSRFDSGSETVERTEKEQS